MSLVALTLRAGITLGLALTLQDEGKQTAVETLNDGSIETYEYVLEDGERVRTGEYQRVFADSDQVAEKGTYSKGKRSGSWKTYYPSGNQKWSGKYKADLKQGLWSRRLDEPKRLVLEQGSYSRGMRKGEWTVWNGPSSVDEVESGVYEVFDGWYVEGRVRARGEVRVAFGQSWRERHGRWVLAWPDGTRMLEAEFVHGEPSGDWRYWHCDGTLDAQFVPRWDQEAGSAAPGGVQLAAIGKMLPKRDKVVARLLKKFLGGRTSMDTEWKAAFDEDAAWIEILRHMAGLELDSVYDLDVADLLLEVLVKFGGVPWVQFSEAGEEGARAANELLVMRIHGYLVMRGLGSQLGREDRAVVRAWDKAHEGASDAERAGWLLLHPPLPMIGLVEAEAMDWSKELDAGLEWLARHQLADGSWAREDVAAGCVDGSHLVKKGKHKGDFVACADGGKGKSTVGVSSLALLSFLRAGHVPGQGPYGQVLTRGIAWLMERPKAPEGRLVEGGHTVVYDQAIGSLAMAEALRLGAGGPELRWLVTATVKMNESIRNPNSAWRYDWTPTGSNDTSVTGWMVAALVAARDAGVKVDQQALLGGQKWVLDVTNPEDGRVGYSQAGSLGARVVGVNDQFPSDSGEALTAIGMTVYLQVEEPEEESAPLEAYADVLMRKMPVWAVEELLVEMYYWRAASEALHRASGLSRPALGRWKSWSKAMRQVAQESQRQDGGSAGSWDPVGAWGWAGGRVCATALMCLALVELDQR